MAVLALGASSMLMAGAALADEYPFVAGDYWEVTGIHIMDGGSLKYANWLASEWRENLEFSKSKGWIKDYMVFANVYPRHGEPDLYLVTVTDRIVSGPESEKRQDEYMAWRKKTIAQMDAESGNRAEYREVMSSSLIQKMEFRK
jgi:hypothetical protein